MSSGLFVLYLVLIGLLAAASAVFSAIETSFFALQPAHLERLKARRARFAASLTRLMENPRRLLSAILLSDALVNLPLIILCLYVLHAQLSREFPFWAACLGIFTLVVFICDLVPKVVALAQPYRTVKVGVRIMNLVLPLADPPARVLQRFSEWVTSHFLSDRQSNVHTLNEEELETLVELSAEAGTLHNVESEMIQEIIKLGDKSVRDCMVPRIDAFLVADDLTNDELRPKLIAQRRRYVPVYGETPDDILGLLDVRAFLTAPAEHYTEMLLTPSFVPETMKALDLLRAFLRHSQPLAIVVDEHGGTEGLINLADVVEEILSDAVPMANRELYIEPVGEGRLLVDGSARLEDINELLGTELAEEGIDTIGGLVFNRLGTLPRPGTEIPVENLIATVRRVSRKRVEELLLTLPQTPAPSTPEEAAGEEEKGEP